MVLSSRNNKGANIYQGPEENIEIQEILKGPNECK